MSVKVDNRSLIAVVAAGAAALTVHGSARAAELGGVPAPWSYLYPVILDGLAIVAWRATTSPESWRARVARVVMVSAAVASGVAQGYALAEDRDNVTGLAWGMGIAPAIVVLLATVLGATREELAPAAEEEPTGHDDVVMPDGSPFTWEPAEEPAPSDPWEEWSVPVSPPAIVSHAGRTFEARLDGTMSPVAPGPVSPPPAVSPVAPEPVSPPADVAVRAPWVDEPIPFDPPAAEPPSDGRQDVAATPPAEDPVAWVLSERRAGRVHTGAEVGRIFARKGEPKSVAKWGQRIVSRAIEVEREQGANLRAVK